MDSKQKAVSILNRLKVLGISREDIEKDLEYSSSYITQALARGGNTRLLKALEQYLKNAETLRKTSNQNEIIDPQLPPELLPSFKKLPSSTQIEELKKRVEWLLAEVDVYKNMAETWKNKYETSLFNKHTAS